MRGDISFNYIITVYNKESLIGRVLNSVIKCCGKNSCVYVVLDGCTDNSEKIIDDIIEKNKNTSIIKVFTNDVHELLSINAGLRKSSQNGTGYNIILEDDVVLEDYSIESKIIDLYEKEGEKLGYVSFRMGANLAQDALKTRSAVPYVDYVENAFGHGLSQAEMLPIGYAAYRTIPIKSPVCIPFKVVREVGFYNERLAPYGHDDIDFALRVESRGYYNLVYAIKFSSELEWGGTRKNGHLVVDSIIERNMDIIRMLYKEQISKIIALSQPKKLKKIEENPIIDKLQCQKIWKLKTKKYSKLKLFLLSVYRIIITFKKKIYAKYKLFVSSKIDLKYEREYSFSGAIENYKNRNNVYNYFDHYYNHRLPKIIKDHRKYIINSSKGYGESAFHAMWWKIILEYKPLNVLEIGVYRGQVISLWSVISKLLNHKINISGISPFSSFGDSVSEYLNNLDYYEDVRNTFKELNLEQPELVKGFSRDKKSVEYIKSKSWDMIYIDGGHDYEDVLFDYKLCLESLNKGGLIIIDDSALYTDYEPNSYSFAGHPGPSLVAREYADKEMKFIGAVGHNGVYQKI